MSLICFLSISKELDFCKVENDVAQVVLNATHTTGRLTILQKTLGELDKEIKTVHDLISRSESEIAKCRLLSENKQAVVIQCNKRLEVLLAQLGVCTFTFQSQT